MKLKSTQTQYAERQINITRSISVENLGAKYQLDVRQYVGIPSVEVIGERIWCLWQTGGDKEPHPENYCVLAYSDDGGESFVDSAMIFESFFEGRQTNVFTPMIITDEKERLIVLFSIKGVYYATVIHNPTAPADELEWDEPREVFRDYLIVNKPLKVQKGGKEVWYFCADKDRAEHTTFIEAAGEDKLSDWQIVGTAKTKHYPNPRNLYHEAMAVQLFEGNFWMLKRLEKGFRGGIEQSFSTDWGRTWTEYESALPYPLIGPGSKFNLLKLNSGNILFISHDSIEERRRLIAHLSTDGGKTFPYSLMLDERGTVSYPETCVAKDGFIYVAYDKGRISEHEIRLAKITEEDIIAGKPVSRGSRLKIPVSTSPERDAVKSILGICPLDVAREHITNEKILSALPEELEVETYKSGVIRCIGYWQILETRKGRALFYTTKSLPYNITDVYGNLKFEI